MSGYIKNFDNGGKISHLKLKRYLKNTEIWNKAKKSLNKIFHR